MKFILVSKVVESRGQVVARQLYSSWDLVFVSCAPLNVYVMHKLAMSLSVGAVELEMLDRCWSWGTVPANLRPTAEKCWFYFRPLPEC